ncbi:type I methionyl aminopeptidase [Candidatus Saccharibacteria bacterium]|nr:type I methionyl aminopeptidase [Candidatus Saccharibacteria bacterium]
MNTEKIQAMREGGKILGNLLRDLKEYVKPGMSEKEVDSWVRKEVEKRGAKVAYDELEEHFPGAICISTNEQLVHGAPSDYVFEEGDKVSFDMVIRYKGYCTDAAFTMLVGGTGRPAVKKMISVTESALWEGIEQVRPGAHLGDIGAAVEKVLKNGKLGVVENYVGHFIGKEMHQEPDVPNYGKKGHGYVLQEGDTLCIEPMSSLGSPKNHVAKDGSGWTVVLNDGSVACHCEHTILVTENGYEVLTLPD